MTKQDERFERQLREAVGALAPAPPDGFETAMGQMIDHLPRKERPVMKRKLSAGLAFALLLCLLTAGAVAVALLTNKELVEQEIVPMAQENDASGLNEVFTNEELGRILALAAENGINLSEDSHIEQAYHAGEGYWEEEVIMAIAKEAFGPIPGQWTLEEQFWFEEVVVAIGFKDYNAARVPGEGELSYDEAYALAKAWIAETYGPAETIHLDDRAMYDLWRGYHAYLGEDGTVQAPTWYFWFEPRDIALNEYEIKLDAAGRVFHSRVVHSLSASLEGTGVVTVGQVRERFEISYGNMWTWSPETWQQFEAWLDLAVDAEDTPLSRVDYIAVPEGGLSAEEAGDRAREVIGGQDAEIVSAVCMMDGDRPIWKVTLRDVARSSRFVEMDCLTGETLCRGLLKDPDGRRYVPESLVRKTP